MKQRTYPALSIASPLVPWLREGEGTLRVHSSFPHAINLTGEDGGFVTLITRFSDDGPFTVRLPLPSLPRLQPGEPLPYSQGNLVAPCFKVMLDIASVYSPALLPCTSAFEALSLPLVADCLRDTASLFAHELLALLFPRLAGRGRDARHSSPLADVTAARLTHFHDAVALKDPAELLEAALSLVGFGQGLTPAGDDFLLGFLAARCMTGRSSQEFESALCASLDGRTTLLSAALLQAACDGHFTSAWHNLAEAVDSKHADQVQSAVRTLKAYGATSGADALAGWLLAVRYHVKEGENARSEIRPPQPVSRVSP